MNTIIIFWQLIARNILLNMNAHINVIILLDDKCSSYDEIKHKSQICVCKVPPCFNNMYTFLL